MSSRFSVEHKGGGALARKVALAQQLGSNPGPFLQKVRAKLIETNRAERVAGKDKQGHRLAAVLRPDDPRRGGTGPRLAPKGANSRVVTRFSATVSRASGPDGREITAGWRGISWLKYHIRGTSRLAKCPIDGPGIGFWNWLRAEFSKFVKEGMKK